MDYTPLSEGACGKIFETSDPQVVIKRVRRGHRKSHGAEEQCRIQSKISQILCEGNGFKLLFAPRAWGATEKEYSMERIDCKRYIDPLNHGEATDLNKDLHILYMKARAYEIFPCDYELYLQPDGRVALIDFDKFGVWQSDGTVETPWGETWSDEFVSQLIGNILGKN